MTRLNVEQAKITTQFPSTKLFPSIRLLYIRQIRSKQIFMENLDGCSVGQLSIYLRLRSVKFVCLFCRTVLLPFVIVFFPAFCFLEIVFPSLPRFETKLTVDDGSFGRLSNQDFIFSPVAFFYYSPFAVCACVYVCVRE